ncbi:BolA family protein [Roseiterribacter gracilis]|uniref:BolA family transcriptional regulator n=1 Tax=Roseiterribacter gracilis TaxID=2812848 RepID=A0A8S8XCB4_9PROT|nr:BolA family transcriptional regulator [Rhodospirillales bacterium TMPK1]
MTGPIADRIRDKLTSRFAPVELSIVDESHKHQGHAGHDARGESHFRVAIVSAEFVGRSRVDRQRLVYDALKDELADRIHALALSTKAPDEA